MRPEMMLRVPVVSLEDNPVTFDERPDPTYSRAVILKPNLPEGHTYGAVLRTTEPRGSLPMGEVWKSPYDLPALLTNLPPLGEKGALEVQTRPTESGEWSLPSYFSPAILNIIKNALAHETLINPNINDARMAITIRVHNVLNSEPAGDIEKPHTDYFPSDASVYTLSSPPATQQFTGPNNSTASSVLPFSLYRMTGNEMHAMPQGESWVELMRSGQSRILVRVTFGNDSEYAARYKQLKPGQFFQEQR